MHKNDYSGFCYNGLKKKWGSGIIMKRKRILTSLFALIFLLAAVIVGCSKQTKTSDSNQATTKIEQKQKSKTSKNKTNKKSATIATQLKDSSKKTLTYSPLGDSISVGLLADKKTDRFTSQFTRTLEKQTGKIVIEKGSAKIGMTATNYGLPHVNEIIAQDPDIVTVEYGTNDGADVNNPRALPNYQSSLDQILTQLQEKTHAKIILITSWSAANGKYVDNYLKFDQAAIKIAQKHNVPVVDLAKIWQGNTSVTGGSAASTALWGVNDTIHPNQHGHDEIAKALTKAIDQPIK